MRDLLLTLIVFGSLPLIVVRPHYGVYMWAWLTYMTPHRLAWGFAYDIRFNYFVAIATIIGIYKSKDIKIRLPVVTPTLLWMSFLSWTTITALLAFYPDPAWFEWNRFAKIQIMIIITYILIKDKQQLIILVGVIAFSLGFFGFKGGLFTLLKGGYFRVMGPDQSFISDNNTFALALNMTLPLMIYFIYISKNYIVRLAMLIQSFLCVLAILGSYSRGGLVGLISVGLTFWIISRKKIITLFLILVIAPAAVVIMPDKWVQRVYPMLESLNIPIVKSIANFNMSNFILNFSAEHKFAESYGDTILIEEKTGIIKKDAEIFQDLSIVGRFDAWTLAIAVANDHPIFGGGFGTFNQTTFNMYTPGVYRRAAHSIYFQVIAEQGYLGGILWALMHLTGLNYGRWVIWNCRKHPDLHWANLMAKMIILGLMGYYGAGISLGLAYYDLPYHFLSLLVILRLHVERKFREKLEIDNKNRKGASRGMHTFPVQLTRRQYTS